ncbi:prokaryotic type I DNA topoisomerase [Coniochaeta sp. PMI_546]|nr:prokaryotic type I DNA topoisomerase [Coniochaeta sp. PMI_546]
MRVLCVAEKNSIAKAVAEHMAGGRVAAENTGNRYIKNYKFDFDFGQPWGRCNVTMTCVSGHLTELTFPSEYKTDWKYPPPDRLFNAPVSVSIPEGNRTIARNIEQQARHSQALFIWTDCDLEGEHIGGEIREVARKANSRIEVKRARFSNIEKAHILTAARRPTALDDRQVEAVNARLELDLRIGFAFTRFLTNNLRPLGGPLSGMVLSYGSCQFPTLGFVVDRYFRVKNFVPEPFWGIKVVHEREDKNITFSWARGHLFDRASVIILFERCLVAKIAKVTKVQEKPTSKWKPLPLTTLEFQKNATRFLRMSGAEAMSVAEGLYQKGFISYPRTETDRFDKGMNLRALCEKQTPDTRWGQFARNLVNGAFQQPRQGRHDDKAHPPIHPITYADPSVLSANEKRVYEFVARRFLACCSEDAKGMATNIDITYGDEVFGAHGVIVLERNYLDVYPYENWTGTTMLPKFTLGEQFEPTEAMMTEGKTSPPSYLTEADLLALMDANGIGTDATMAEHIKKILDRKYVFTHQREGARGLTEFIPSALGCALIEGFDRMNFETSLGKPFLRKEMELKMKAICNGRTTKQTVLQESLTQYRQVYDQSQEQLGVLRAVGNPSLLRHGIPLELTESIPHP